VRTSQEVALDGEVPSLTIAFRTAARTALPREHLGRTRAPGRRAVGRPRDPDVGNRRARPAVELAEAGRIPTRPHLHGNGKTQERGSGVPGHQLTIGTIWGELTQLTAGPATH
jgi:hypothetical protein